MRGASRPLVALVIVLLVEGTGAATMLLTRDEPDPPPSDPSPPDPSEEPGGPDAQLPTDESDEPALAPLTGETIDQPLERPIVATKVENSLQAVRRQGWRTPTSCWRS